MIVKGSEVNTVGDLARLWRERMGGYGQKISKKGGSIGKREKPVCFGMKYRSLHTNNGTSVVPGSFCTGISTNPTLNACYLDGPVNLEHGEVSADLLSNNTVVKGVNLRCVEKATVNVSITSDRLDGYVNLSSDGSLLSSIYINGSNHLEGVNVSVPGGIGGTNVEFKSQLTVNGTVKTGRFAGSAIAVITIM